jgi:hypothetical protein
MLEMGEPTSLSNDNNLTESQWTITPHLLEPSKVLMEDKLKLMRRSVCHDQPHSHFCQANNGKTNSICIRTEDLQATVKGLAKKIEELQKEMAIHHGAEVL